MSTTIAQSRISSSSLRLAAAAFLVALAALGTPPAKTSLSAKALPGGADAEVSLGPQILQADYKGRLFLLRAGSLEAAPFLPSGVIGTSTPLKVIGEGGKEPRLRAAMSAGGDWLLRAGAKCRLFRAGKEVPILDPGWLVWSPGWLRDDPVLAVDPIRTVRDPAPKGSPPLILRWSGSAWETFVSEALPKGGPDPYDMPARQARAVELLGDSKGALWAANRNRYLLRRYSASGKLRLTIQVGEGRVEQQKDAKAAQQTFAKDYAKTKSQPPAEIGIQAATALAVTEAMAEGRDGNLYLLVHHAWPGGDFALDRYDAVRSVLERAPLRLKDLGVMTMASGKDGLYIAAFSERRGRWQVSWEDIDAMAWTPVKDVKINEIDQAAGEQPE